MNIEERNINIDFEKVGYSFCKGICRALREAAIIPLLGILIGLIIVALIITL